MSIERNGRIHDNHVRRLVLDAMLCALFVVFAVYLSLDFQLVEVSWSSLPILLAAFLLGLPDALAIAFIGSFLEQMLAHGLSLTTPLWILPFLLQAVVAGLFSSFARRMKREEAFILFVVVAIIPAELVLTVANTAALYADGAIMNWAPAALHVMLPGKLVNFGVRTLLSCVAVPSLLLALRRILRLQK